MYRGLVDNLAFVYGFICKGRGRIKEEDMRGIVNGAHTIVKNAPAVLGGDNETEEDKKDLALAGNMDLQLEQAMVFIQSLEIV